MFFALLRSLCGQQPKDFFPNLLWMLRQEYGGAFGRAHFHFLIAGLHRKKTNAKTCRWLDRRWKEIVSPKGGWLRGSTEIQVYNRALGGLRYVLKLDEDQTTDRRESAKFGPADCELMLSNALERRLGLR
jgi:hypothetical protein